MDKDRLLTQLTYIRSAEELAEYYEGMGPRTPDIDRAIELCGVEEPKVIELGCGPGRDAQVILERTPHYIGFDISGPMIRRAREVNDNGDFKVADIASVQIPLGVDIIFAFNSLLHSDEDEVHAVLQRAAEALNLGGIFYISLKKGRYGSVPQEDRYGFRLFYMYMPDDIVRMAGEGYDAVFCDEHFYVGSERFVIALRRASNA